MKKRIKRLTSEEISILKGRYNPLRFINEFDLVYESQVPNTGIVLLEGEIALCKKRKIHETILPGCLIGVYELINNEPVKLGCKVKSNAELIMIQKSEILDALNDKDPELYEIIKENL